MIREILFCYKEYERLRVRKSILTDVFVPVQDVISPQKTTLTIPKTLEIKVSDIVIILNNSSSKIEYIGYIDTIKTKTTTKISCYPIINIFDNDYVLTQMYEETKQIKRDDDGKIVYNEDGTKQTEIVDSAISVYNWLVENLTKAFIYDEKDTTNYTNDPYQALPLKFRNKLKAPVFYKKILDTSNLFEVYTDLFINTGVYIEFNDIYVNNSMYIDGIYCDIYCNNDEDAIFLRWDNPQIQDFEIVDNTFTNYNKVIATEKQEEDENTGKLVPENPKHYIFYLLDNNSITTNPNIDKDNEAEEISYNEQHKDDIAKGLLKKKYLGRRFKQVRCKEITFDIEEDKTDKENTNTMLLAVFNELQSSEYNVAITITMFKNDRIKLHKIVDFAVENGTIYTSRITKLEILNDKQIKITLGALRNNLTDFKKKIEEI